MADSPQSEPQDRSIAGRLVGVTNKTDLQGITAWFAYQEIDGEGVTVKAVSDDDGYFSFDLPMVPLQRATVGAEIEGVEPVDLEPNGKILESGDLVLVVDDIVASHLSYSGA
ncbi:MAG: hypothetical protein GY773_24255 [Actinomycetia bacterium]|nr:hypothetical protein [Actinomycetes bacterium]